MKLSVVREHVETLRKRTTYRKVIDAEKGNRAPFGTHIGSIVRWILRLRKELASLAAAVETSGVVCPVCEGSKKQPTHVPATGKFRGVVDFTRPIPCETCSVKMMEHAECEACEGTGLDCPDSCGPAIHQDCEDCDIDECPHCHGLGHRPGPIREVALGKVYPRKDEE